MRKYYVYTLEDKDNKVFYVGKGSKTESYDRIEYHLKYWFHNKNRKLTNKIRKLKEDYTAVIVFESEFEEECLCKEVELITYYGIENLCNLTGGGEGVSGYRHTLESRVKMSLKVNKDISIKNLKKACEVNTGRRKADKFNIVELYKTKSIYEIKRLTGLDFTTIKNYLIEKDEYVKNKNRKQESNKTRNAKSKSQKLRNRRTVYQFSLEGDLQQSWRCALEAVTVYGVCIYDALRGKQKTAYNYRWSYEK